MTKDAGNKRLQRRVLREKDAEMAYSLARGSLAGTTGNSRDFWLMKAAEWGNAEAQCQLGFNHFSGIFMHYDFERALTWFSKAAAQNHPEAMYWLGSIYFEGWKVKKEQRRGAKLMVAAADAGHERAYMMAYFIFETGAGLGIIDRVRSRAYLQKAAESADPMYAFSELSRIYTDGDGVPRCPGLAAIYDLIVLSRYKKCGNLLFCMGSMHIYGGNMAKCRWRGMKVLHYAIKEGCQIISAWLILASEYRRFKAYGKMVQVLKHGMRKNTDPDEVKYALAKFLLKFPKARFRAIRMIQDVRGDFKPADNFLKRVNLKKLMNAKPGRKHNAKEDRG